MFTAAAAAAAAAFSAAVASAGAAVAAGIVFGAKAVSVFKECFAFSAKKDGIGLFIKTKAGCGIPSFFICAVVAYKVAV